MDVERESEEEKREEGLGARERQEILTEGEGETRDTDIESGSKTIEMSGLRKRVRKKKKRIDAERGE